jgi:hypothetical protein
VLAPKQWDVHGYADGKDVTADTGLNLAQAAGSVVSTVEDVDAFFQNLWAGNLLSPDLVEQMSRPVGDIPPVLWRVRAGNLDDNVQLRGLHWVTAATRQATPSRRGPSTDRHGLSSSWSTRAVRTGTGSPTLPPKPTRPRSGRVVAELELHAYFAVEWNEQRRVVRVPGGRNQEHPIPAVDEQAQVPIAVSEGLAIGLSGEVALGNADASREE